MLILRCRQQQRDGEVHEFNRLRLEANQARLVPIPDYGHDDDVVNSKVAEAYLHHASEIVYAHVKRQKPPKVVVISLLELQQQNNQVASGNNDGANSTLIKTKQMRGRLTQVLKNKRK